MAEENIDIQQQESQSQEITPAAQGITFEDILPWGMQGGDTGLSSRLKLKRNFDKIKTRFNVDQALYLSKINDDTAQGFIRFIRGLQVGERFVTGLLGEGGIFRKEADGTTYIEADKLYIRIKAYFDNVEIRDFKHSAGNRIASPAGMKCCRVEWLDAGGDVVSQADANLPQVVKFRCYFRGNDGEDEVRNNFIVGDQAYCHITSVDTKADDPNSKGLNMKHYWRLVVGRNPSGTLTADGEHWIDLSNRSSETLKIDGRTYTHAGCQDGSDIPMTQDDIIQLGNIYDTDRMGAIIEFVTGADSPSYQIFQDINDFNLNGKNYIALGYSTQTGRAYLNVYGDTFIGDPEESTYIRYNAQTKKLDVKATVTFVSPTTHEDTTIEDFAAAVTSDINTIQNQIDGTIETWFYNGEPSDSTLPESQWKAIDEAAGNNNERLKHLGDMYYDNQTGYAYRYANQGTESQPKFVWTPISDSAVVKALADAAKAQDTADHKRRVFVVQPTPPYDAGDMWVNAVWPESGESQGSTYNNDILRCKTAKISTQSFSINDWGLASKYTDDSALNYFIENTYAQDVEIINTQIDKKAETWYQDSDPSDAWTTDELKSEHVGDIWCDTSSNGGKKTWIYRDRGEGQDNRYYWAEQSVPDDVFDQIDGKAAIYVNTVESPPSNYHEKDLWILPDDATINGVTYKKGEVLTATSSSATYNAAHWTKKISYTDDSAFNAYINQILNGSGASGDSATVANAIRTIKGALNEGTAIDGGLVLTSLLAMRSNNKVWAGISGVYDDSLTTGGIAAWFGGAMKDKDVDVTATDCAKSLFRMDGSGYVANGNIAWDSTGLTTLNVSSVSADTIKLGGKGVATQDWVTQNYISIAYFDRLFRAYNGNTIVQHNDVESTIDNIKAMFGFWTDAYVSALGKGTGGGDMVLTEPLQSINSANLGAPTTANVGIVWNGSKWVYGSTGGGGTDMATVWAELGASTTNQINASHLTNALGSYAQKTELAKYLPLTGGTMTSTIFFNNMQSGKDAGINCTLDTRNVIFGIGTSGNAGMHVAEKGWIMGIDASDNVFLNGNATSATKLQTPRTIWGQSFDGSGNVSGSLSGVADISSSSYFLRDSSTNPYLNLKVGSQNWFVQSMSDGIYLGSTSPNSLRVDASGNATVVGTFGVSGATTLSSTLSVSGLLTASGGITIPSGKTLTIGDAELSWDATNQGIKVTKGLYSETFISALGTGSSGGTATTLATLADVNVTGVKNDDVLTYNSTTKKWEAKAVQTGTDMATVWAELGASTTNQINASHLTNALGSYAQKSELSEYLQLTGGTMTGNLTVSGIYEPCVRVYKSGVADDSLLIGASGNHGLYTVGKGFWCYLDTSGNGHFVGNALTSASCSGNSATATTLQTSRTIWGQSFDGSGNVSGSLSGVGDITSSSSYSLRDSSTNPYLNLKVGSQNWFVQGMSDGLYLGSTSLNSLKIDASGNAEATKFIGALQGNADSATTASKLSVVSKTAWGQTYWTSGGIPTTISGNMTDVGSIAMSGAITGATTISASSNVSIGGTLSVTGATTLYSTLGVDGLLTSNGGIKIPSGKTLTIGDAVLSWDSSNQGIKITKGLYSETFISAYGRGSDSGAATSLSSLSDVNISGVANGMALVYRSGTWRAETISSGTSGNYLPLSGGTMTGDIITPANDNLGIRPASNNYGQIGTSSYKFYRMYASTFYGELDGTISDETRGSFITSNNEFNFVPQAYTKDDLHFNYKAANSELCNRTITTYCFDDGNKNTLCSITSSGASAGSDIRKKDVKEYFRLRLDDIVSAPLIRFSWKHMNDKSLQVGSIAQYWKDVLPESVIEGTDGYLFMNDAKVALACSISLASNVQDHERRIAELEKENERLRTEIEQLKIA